MKNINKSARNIKDVKLIKHEGTNIYDLFKVQKCNNDFNFNKKLQERILNEKTNHITQLEAQLLLKKLQFYQNKIKQFLKFIIKQTK